MTALQEVAYKHARMFLVICNRLLRGYNHHFDDSRDIESDQAKIRIANKTTAEIHLLVGEAEPPTQEAPVPGISVLCDNTAKAFDIVAKLTIAKLSLSKATQSGRDQVAASILQLWQEIGSSINADSAEVLDLGLREFSAQGVARIFEDMEKELRRFATFFRELGEKSKDVEEVDESEDGNNDRE